MDIIRNNRKWICRICLKNTDDDSINIFSGNLDMTDLPGKITECSGIPMEENTHFPKMMCPRCLVLLKAAMKFRMLCQKSHRQLTNLVRRPPVTTDDTLRTSDDIEENSVESDVNCVETENSEALHETQVPTVQLNKAEHHDNDLEEDEPYLDLPVSNEIESIEYIEDNEDDFIIEENSNIDIDDNQYTEKSCETLRIDTIEFDDGIPQDEHVNERKWHRKGIVRGGAAKTHTNRNAKKPTAKLPRIEDITISYGKVDETVNTYICFECGNIYTEKAKLTTHLKLHTKEKPHECEICHKRFTQAPQLSRHMNSHTGNRPFKCKFCSSSFADPSTCIKHQRIHTKERPFKCGSCGKAFAYSNVLKIHVMTHTGEKPYSCGYCDKKFSQLHHKKSHERIHTFARAKRGRRRV